MRNQLCVTPGVIVGQPNSAVSQNTGNEYCNFVLEVPGQTKGSRTHKIPMVSFKLTAEYIANMNAGQVLYVQYNVGSRTFTNEYGEERTNLSIYADEAFGADTMRHMPAPSAMAQGFVTEDPHAEFSSRGTMDCRVKIEVANEWMGRDGNFESRPSSLVFLFTGQLGEQIAEKVQKGMWMLVGFHLESRTFNKRDDTEGYQPYLVGEWYEVDTRANATDANVDQQFDSAVSRDNPPAAAPQRSQQPAGTAAFDPFASTSSGDLKYE